MDLGKDLFLKLVYYIVFPFLLISYLCEPLMVDVRIYLGVAKVTALTPGFPMTLDSVWESRFIGHRFLYYVLNLLDPFTGWLYSIWMKLIVAIVTIVILYYFSKRVSEKMHVSIHYPFVFGFLALFAINNFVIFSSEYFSVLIAIIMLTGLLDDRKSVWFLSGLLILPLLIMKGLPVLLIFVVGLVVILLVSDYKPRIYTALASLPVTILSCLGLALYFPHFISDFILARQIAHISYTFDFPKVVHILVYFSGYLLIIWEVIPVILIGLLALILIYLSVPKPVSVKHFRDFMLLVAMWGVSALYVLIIGEFLYYHYYLMVIPSCISVCYFFSIYTGKYKDWIFTAMIVTVIIITIATVAGWSVGLNFKQYNYWSGRDSAATNISTNYPDLLDQPSLLYLDPGNAAYYFPNPSSCRYVSPAPYQRDMPDWDMTTNPEYWSNRNCSLSYTGKYIIVDPDWFNLTVTTHADIFMKLSTEYTKVYSDPWEDIYQRNGENVLKKNGVV